MGSSNRAAVGFWSSVRLVARDLVTKIWVCGKQEDQIRRPAVWEQVEASPIPQCL
jgi:hypothetical protein